MKYFFQVFLIFILLEIIHLTYSKEVHFWLLDSEECLDGCAKRKEKYYWCNTVQSGWRKCSFRDGFDSYDRPCIKGCNSNVTKGCNVNIPGWTSGPTECSEVRTIPDSYTKNGDVCRNTCGKYGKSYYWCYTIKNWDYCTPTTYVTFKDTSNISNYELTRTLHSWKIDNEECLDECAKRDDSDYYWCHTVVKGWRKCSVKDGFDSYDRPCLYGCDSTKTKGCSVRAPGWFGKTEIEIHECSDVRIVSVSYTNKGELCNNTCGHYGKDYSWCYTMTNWDYCTISTDKPVVETIYNYNYKLIANENSENDNICVLNDPFCTHIKDCLKKSKRAVNNQCINVAETIERYFTFLAAVAGCAVLRILVINPRTYRSDDPMTRAYFRTISRTTIRLEAIEANLDASHYNGRNNVNQVFRSRRDFTEWGLSNVRDFRNQFCAEPRDERGHIVADVFGGYPEFYNVFPQARNVNRGRGSIWRGLENLMARFLSAGQPGGDGGHVIWRVAFYYVDDEDLRPLEIWVRAVFYDANGNEITEGDYIADQHILDNRE